ncbi:MAG TPA: M56 family metallopeptidase [Caulifigura sp.]|jgi:beta-lactamase regulating signal transducer with metallopeptidase domain|nr:M56 family metallopeptidase [Caulifigura sp.]
MTPSQFLEFLISVSVQAAIVVCLTHWLCRIVETPRVQCRLWATCHVLLLLLLVTGASLPHFRVLHPWRALSSEAAEQVVVMSSAAGRFVLVGWVLGAIVSLMLLTREWSRAFQFLKTCRPAGDRERDLVMQIEGLSRSLEPGDGAQLRSVQLLLSDRIGSPFCCQWHRPQLVLPEFIAQCSPDEVQSIARHEIEHLRSGHPLQLFVERLVATFFWFHPVVWWAGQQSSIAREFACDDAAVSGRREIITYLKTLIAVAERGMSEEAEGAVLFFGRGASVVAMRGRRLLRRAESSDEERPARRGLGLQVVLVAAALLAAFVWAPLDALASTQTKWSPWPRWSASALRAFDVPARDFEPYDRRTRLHEISEQAQESRRQSTR